MGLSMGTAELWVDRWERQQRRYAIDREERFTVIADVVEHVTEGQDRPLIVDLGCGPGSLAACLADRLPHAEVVAVDMDPVLLELARTHHASAARYVDTVIGEDGWTEALALDRPLDAAVSTTALHYFPQDTLRQTYTQLAALLRPGGALINGDHLPPDCTAPAALAAHVGNRRAERQQACSGEDWESWWTAVADESELAASLAERRRRHSALNGSLNGGDNGLTLSDHAELLCQAGFAHAFPVWQFGHSCVLVAIR
ncbi:class I SAM-dependent methyltransferase [Streptomyces sp. NRRL S-1448]|uniref:class I SAM-dependent methyltransferase n=1 Tax=Streptomyces sp. NRRL S-1448 TaxID=1463883 RepID=UPI0004C13BFD|nr:class I SAM-dependent methyltransferase [Streptomyces sp. NRRL S-1448]